MFLAEPAALSAYIVIPVARHSSKWLPAVCMPRRGQGSINTPIAVLGPNVPSYIWGVAMNCSVHNLIGLISYELGICDKSDPLTKVTICDSGNGLEGRMSNTKTSNDRNQRLKMDKE